MEHAVIAELLSIFISVAGEVPEKIKSPLGYTRNSKRVNAKSFFQEPTFFTSQTSPKTCL